MPDITLERVDERADVPRLNIVFVHGLGGNPTTYWCHEGGKDGSYFWLRGLAEDVPGTAVWTLGYPADKTSWGTGWPVAEAATAVLDKLMSSREFQAIGDIPIVLVCHSLGGIIAKRLVLTAHLDRGQQPTKGKFLDRISGIVFLATPHGGSILASIASTAHWFVSSAMNDLTASNSSLLDLNHNYRDRIANDEATIRHRVYYEGVGVWGAEVVTPVSADPGLPGVRPVKVNRDHTRIQKPVDKKDVVYEGILAFLQDEVLQPRPASASRKLDEILRRTEQSEAAEFEFSEYRRTAEDWQRDTTLQIETTSTKLDGAIQRLEAKIEGVIPLKTENERSKLHSVIEQGVAAAHKIAQQGAALGDERCKMAVALIQAGKTAESEFIFRALAGEMEIEYNKAAKNAAASYRNLGAVIALHDPKRAVDAYKMALRFDPDDWESMLCIGSIQQEHGTLAEAAMQFRSVLSFENPGRTS